MSTETKWTLEGAEQLISRAKHPPVYVADLELDRLDVMTGRNVVPVLQAVGAPVEWLPSGWSLLTMWDAGFLQVWAVPALADDAPAFDVLLAVDVLVDETR